MLFNSLQQIALTCSACYLYLVKVHVVLTSEYAWLGAWLTDCAGSAMRSTIRYAARLAVYEQTKMRAKNHQTVPTILPDRDLDKRVNIRYSYF